MASRSSSATQLLVRNLEFQILSDVAIEGRYADFASRSQLVNILSGFKYSVSINTTKHSRDST